MTATTFDTHKFVRKLKEAGLPEMQAEAIADAFRDAQGEADLATKVDLRELEYRLTIKLGSLIALAIGIVAALVKLAYSLLAPRQEHSRVTQGIDSYVILRVMLWRFLE